MGEIFTKIDYKLLEIISLIEHENNFPILSRDVDTYVNSSLEHARLYNIYLKVSELRNI